MAQKGELPSRKAVYRYYRDVGEAAVDTVYLNMADYLAARGPNLERQEWADHCRVVGHILREGVEQKAPGTLPKLLDGRDIMHAFNLEPGPEVGRLVELVREARASGEITTRDGALQLVESDLGVKGAGGA
jgi:poly(A) polymerase